MTSRQTCQGLWLGVRDLANAQKDRENHYAFKFPAVAWQPGKIEATAYSGNNEWRVRTK